MQENKFQSLKVTVREALTPDVIRLRLQADKRGELPAFTAGAHVYLRINEQFLRPYSLCSDPSHRDYYDIAVKCKRNGRGGSLALHKTAHVGAHFEVSAPKNHFPLANDADHHLLVGGGIGLTPLIAMAYQLSAEGKPFTLLICTRDPASVPFAAQLASSGWPVEYCLNPRKNLDLNSYLQPLPANTHVYCCGPTGLMDAARTQCLTLPQAQWHEERFGDEAQTVATGFDLYLSISDKHVFVPAGRSIIATLREAGVHVDSVCEQGICGSCVVAWSDGEPIHGDQCLEPEEREKYIALCCGGCRSKSMTLEL